MKTVKDLIWFPVKIGDAIFYQQGLLCSADSHILHMVSLGFIYKEYALAFKDYDLHLSIL